MAEKDDNIVTILHGDVGYVGDGKRGVRVAYSGEIVVREAASVSDTGRISNQDHDCYMLTAIVMADPNASHSTYAVPFIYHKSDKEIRVWGKRLRVHEVNDAKILLEYVKSFPAAKDKKVDQRIVTVRHGHAKVYLKGRDGGGMMQNQ